MRFKLPILTFVAGILPFLPIKQAAAAPALDVLPRSPIACDVKCQALISAFGYKLVDNAIIVARAPEDPECPKPHCTGYGKHKSCCGEAPVARSPEEPVCPKPHCTGYGKHKACGCGQAPSKEFLNALNDILGTRALDESHPCHNLVCEDPHKPWTCTCRDPPAVEVTARGPATPENDLATSHPANVARDDEDCEHWVCGDPTDPSTCICQGLSAVEVATRNMAPTPEALTHLVARGNEDCDDWYCPDPNDPSSCFCRDHGAIEVTTRDTPPTADALAHLEARYEPCQNWVCDDPSDPATCYCKDHGTALDIDLARRLAPCNEWHCDDPSDPYSCYCNDHSAAKDTKRAMPATPDDLAQFTTRAKDAGLDDHDAAVLRRCHQQICSNPSDPTTCTCLDPPLPPVEPPPPGGGSLAATATRDMNPTADALAELQGRASQGMSLFRRGCNLICPDPADPSSCYCGDGPQERDDQGEGFHGNLARAGCHNWVCKDPNIPSSCYCNPHRAAARDEEVERSEERAMYNDLAVVARKECTQWICKDPNIPSSCYCKNHDAAPTVEKAKERAVGLPHCHLVCTGYLQERKCSTCCGSLCGPALAVSDVQFESSNSIQRDVAATNSERANVKYPDECRTHCSPIGLCKTLCTRPPTVAVIARDIEATTNEERGVNTERAGVEAKHPHCRTSCDTREGYLICHSSCPGGSGGGGGKKPPSEATMARDILAAATAIEERDVAIDAKGCHTKCNHEGLECHKICYNPPAETAKARRQLLEAIASRYDGHSRPARPHRNNCHVKCNQEKTSCHTICYNPPVDDSTAVDDLETATKDERAVSVTSRQQPDSAKCHTKCNSQGLNCHQICYNPPAARQLLEAAANEEREVTAVSRDTLDSENCRMKCNSQGLDCHKICYNPPAETTTTTARQLSESATAATAAIEGRDVAIQQSQCRLVCDYKKGYPDCHTECPKPPTQDTVTREALEAAEINEERDVSLDAGHSQPANPHQKGCHTKCDKHGHNCHTTCSKPPADGADKEKRDVAAATTTSSLEERTCRQICAGYMQFKHCYPCCANCPPAMEAAGFNLVEDGEVTRLTLDGKVL